MGTWSAVDCHAQHGRGRPDKTIPGQPTKRSRAPRAESNPTPGFPPTPPPCANLAQTLRRRPTGAPARNPPIGVFGAADPTRTPTLLPIPRNLTKFRQPQVPPSTPGKTPLDPRKNPPRPPEKPPLHPRKPPPLLCANPAQTPRKPCADLCQTLPKPPSDPSFPPPDPSSPQGRISPTDQP